MYVCIYIHTPIYIYRHTHTHIYATIYVNVYIFIYTINWDINYIFKTEKSLQILGFTYTAGLKSKPLTLNCGIYIYIYIYIYIPQLVFANGLGDLGSILGRVIPQTKKNGTWYLLAQHSGIQDTYQG